MSGVPGNGDALRLLEALDRMRAEFHDDIEEHEGRMRHDLGAVEVRLKNQIEAARTEVQTYIKDHGSSHTGIDASISDIKSKFTSEEIRDARRDGALSLGLTIFSIIARHWQIIIGVAFLIVWVVQGVSVEFGRPTP